MAGQAGTCPVAAAAKTAIRLAPPHANQVYLTGARDYPSPAQVQGTLHIVIYRPNQIATPVHKVGPPNQPSNNVNGGLTTIPQNQVTEPFTREIL